MFPFVKRVGKQRGLDTHFNISHLILHKEVQHRIYLAIRRGFLPSRMTSNN